MVMVETVEAVLKHCSGEYVQDALETERGELPALEQQVVESLRQDERLMPNLNEDFDAQGISGTHLTAALIRFGGSWILILCFAAVWIAWIEVNSVAMHLAGGMQDVPARDGGGVYPAHFLQEHRDM
jgi:hypothetical protein